LGHEAAEEDGDVGCWDGGECWGVLDWVFRKKIDGWLVWWGWIDR